jgi:TonB family protein
MTTFATFGGMLPLAMGIEAGSSTQAPLGTVVIGGLMTSTLLSLVVVPTLYLLVANPVRAFASFALAALLAVAPLAVPAPARANTFCPVTVAAVENLGTLGRGNTYGVMLALDPSDASSVRLRIDSAANRYAVDFNDLPSIGTVPVRERRYLTMPAGERVVAAWVESTGTSPTVRTECPITSPYQFDAPAPLDQRAARAQQADRTALRDNFSTRTTTATPQAFGRAEPRSCSQPYAPARTILAAPTETPPEARAVRATGVVIVRVDLDENSAVIDGAIVRSSGFAPLDRAALSAALKSTYRTETFACRPIASSYQYTISFN